MSAGIPRIEIGPLLGPASPERERTDREIMAASAEAGFFIAAGLDALAPLDSGTRANLLRIFALPDAALRKLWRQKFDPANANVYRGWFPLQQGFLTSKVGIDMGPDVAYGPGVVRAGDPLREHTPLPSSRDLPGWHEIVAAYYLAMERISRALIRSIARSLGLAQEHFDGAFVNGGLSTLRLIRYPLRTDADRVAETDPSVWVEHRGERPDLTRGPPRA